MFSAKVKTAVPMKTLKKGDIIVDSEGHFRKVIGVGVPVTEYSDSFENATNRPVGDNADYGRTLSEADLADYTLVTSL